MPFTEILFIEILITEIWNCRRVRSVVNAVFWRFPLHFGIQRITKFFYAPSARLLLAVLLAVAVGLDGPPPAVQDFIQAISEFRNEPPIETLTNP